MMHKPINDTLLLLGRLLMAWLFIPAGLSKITGFSGAVTYAASAGLPMPEMGVAAGLIIELIGGVLILVGLMTRPAACILAFFTLVASFVFHAYWNAPVEQSMVQQLLFNKNIAVIGGLLAFAALGAGAFSIDSKRSSL